MNGDDHGATPVEPQPDRPSRRARRAWPRRLVIAVAVVALGLGGLNVWARANLDSSTLARTLVWFEADVGDIDRFPQREIRAPDAASPLPECAQKFDVATAVTSGGDSVPLDSLLADTGTRGFMVLRDGCVAAEYYGEGADDGTLLTSFSVAKSVLATLIGIAVQRGDLPSLDVPVTRYVPELGERDPRFGDVTLRALMAMSSGLGYEEKGTPWSDDAVTYYGVDLRDVALSARVEEPPMTRWLYNNYNPLIAGLVLERATGMSVASYAENYLWAPLGADDNASWSMDSTASGFEKLESGFNATLRDWARFGLLAARSGAVGDSHVATPEFWDEATAPQQGSSAVVDPGYGLWWWLDTESEGAFMARGNFGQFIYVDPGANVVVLRFGTDFGIEDWPDILNQIATEAAVAGGRPTQ